MKCAIRVIGLSRVATKPIYPMHVLRVLVSSATRSWSRFVKLCPWRHQPRLSQATPTRFQNDRAPTFRKIPANPHWHPVYIVKELSGNTSSQPMVLNLHKTVHLLMHFPCVRYMLLTVSVLHNL